MTESDSLENSSNIENLKSEDHPLDFLKPLKKEYKSYLNFEKKFLHYINEVFSKIKLRQHFDFHSSSLFVNELSKNFHGSKSYLFFLNTKKNNNNLATTTYIASCYTIFSLLNYEKYSNNLELCTTALSLAIINQSYFQIFPFTKLKQDRVPHNSTHNLSLVFLREHSKEGLKKINPSSFSGILLKQSQLINQLLLKKITPEDKEIYTKIPSYIKVISFAQEFAYFTTSFFKDYFNSLTPTEAILNMLRRPVAYDGKILKNFVKLNSIYPPGELIHFTSTVTNVIDTAISISPSTTSNLKESYFLPVTMGSLKQLSHEDVLHKQGKDTFEILTIVSDKEERKKLITRCYSAWF